MNLSFKCNPLDDLVFTQNHVKARAYDYAYMCMPQENIGIDTATANFRLLV